MNALFYRGNFRGGRGGFVPGRPSTNKKDTLKFESDYDFDAANEEFQGMKIVSQQYNFIQ